MSKQYVKSWMDNKWSGMVIKLGQSRIHNSSRQRKTSIILVLARGNDDTSDRSLNSFNIDIPRRVSFLNARNTTSAATLLLLPPTIWSSNTKTSGPMRSTLPNSTITTTSRWGRCLSIGISSHNLQQLNWIFAKFRSTHHLYFSSMMPIFALRNHWALNLKDSCEFKVLPTHPHS